MNQLMKRNKAVQNARALADVYAVCAIVKHNKEYHTVTGYNNIDIVAEIAPELVVQVWYSKYCRRLYYQFK